MFKNIFIEIISKKKEKTGCNKKTTAFKKPRREKGLRQVADTFFFKKPAFS
jgi:hypothetical protein